LLWGKKTQKELIKEDKRLIYMTNTVTTQDEEMNRKKKNELEVR